MKLVSYWDWRTLSTDNTARMPYQLVPSNGGIDSVLGESKHA